MIKLTDSKVVLHGCGMFKLLDKLNAKALTPHAEMAIMKEEGVFGTDTSAYTFDPAHLNPTSSSRSHTSTASSSRSTSEGVED